MIQFHSRRNLAFSRLQSSFLLINQAVGDAISDMLLSMVSLQVSFYFLSNNRPLIPLLDPWLVLPRLDCNVH